MFVGNPWFMSYWPLNLDFQGVKSERKIQNLTIMCTVMRLC